MGYNVCINNMIRSGIMAGRSIEERIQLIDARIAKKEAELDALKKKREELMHPAKMSDIVKKLREKGITAQEVAEKFNIEL